MWHSLDRREGAVGEDGHRDVLAALGGAKVVVIEVDVCQGAAGRYDLRDGLAAFGAEIVVPEVDARQGAAGRCGPRDSLDALGAEIVVRKVDSCQGTAGVDGLRDGLAALCAEIVEPEVDTRQGAALRNCLRERLNPREVVPVVGKVVIYQTASIRASEASGRSHKRAIESAASVRT